MIITIRGTVTVVVVGTEAETEVGRDAGQKTGNTEDPENAQEVVMDVGTENGNVSVSGSVRETRTELAGDASLRRHPVEEASKMYVKHHLRL